MKKGDLLFTLDPRTLEAQLAQAAANLKRDEALLTQAEAQLGRDVANAKRRCPSAPNGSPQSSN